MKRKQNKNNISLFFIYIGLIMSIFLCSCSQKNTETYICPMHPEVTSNKAGQTCPKCKMMLELVKKEVNKATDSVSVDDLLEPTNEKVLASVGLTKPERKTLPSLIKCNGVIAYDPHSYQGVSSLFSGRIERLYVKYPFQAVQKGEKLFDVYSPEMVTEQQNLIYMLNTSPIDQQMVNATKQKLSLLGMSAQQIAEVERTKVAKKIFTVYSPYSGYLVGNESNTTQTSSKGNAMGGGGNASGSQTAQNFNFREGAYIEKGQTIFSMANNRKVWAILKIYEKDIQLISPKLKVEIITEDPQSPIYKAQVDFIEPFNGSNSKMFNVRVYLDNENQKLKIGQLVNGSITAKSQTGLWIPKSAVIDLGMSKVVFMKENQIFHAMPVVTGGDMDKWTQIVSGIDENTEIASDAHYLIDSESFIPHKKHGM